MTGAFSAARRSAHKVEGRVAVSGPSLDISPKQTLALSLALHELATNAAKHGALSRPEGRVELHWKARDGQLHLGWRESGGPKVVPPSRRGFGSRLLEGGLFHGPNENTRLEFAADGVRYSIVAALASASDIRLAI